jgi:hypothetical protein
MRPPHQQTDRPPHTPSQLHAQGQLDPAPSKAISYQTKAISYHNNPETPNKTDAGTGSKASCRVIGASCS